MEQQLAVLVDVLVAMVLAGIVGIEREIESKPAGLRTHMFVGGAAALLVGIANAAIALLSTSTGDIIRTDPIRIIEAVITGVTFLGAGTIIRNRAQVKGLTTAASLLFVAALGITVALDQYILAVGATVLALVTLRVIKWLEDWIDAQVE